MSLLQGEEIILIALTLFFLFLGQAKMVVLVVYGRETKCNESASGSMWCSINSHAEVYIYYLCPVCVRVRVCVVVCVFV